MQLLIRATVATLLSSIFCTAQAEFKPADPTPYVTDAITVSGLVKQTITLSVADLRAMPAHALSDVVLVCLSGANKGNAKNYRGVLLRDVITRANIEAVDKSDLKKTLIVAAASDHYIALFTWGELFNTPVGDAVLVVYEKDGVPLSADEGHIALISGTDLRTGPRHVKWLKSIELRKVSE
jgi:DMSO/TMAO reductase YedYZ molybdopterin-dependent catalytic subunit